MDYYLLTGEELRSLLAEQRHNCAQVYIHGRVGRDYDGDGVIEKPFVPALPPPADVVLDGDYIQVTRKK